MIKIVNKDLSELHNYINLHLKNKPIIFVGMMGAGKSAIGRLIAKSLNRIFYDIDQNIERHHQDERNGGGPEIIFRVFGTEFIGQPAAHHNTDTAGNAENKTEPCADFTGAHAEGANEKGRSPCDKAIADKGCKRRGKGHVPKGFLGPEILESFSDTGLIGAIGAALCHAARRFA